MRKVIAKILTIEAGASQKIAFLFLALNAFGYDDENNPRGMNVVRRKARAVLRRGDFRSAYPSLQYILKSHHPWALLHILVSLERRNSKGFRKFLTEFNKFSREPIVLRLWQSVRQIQFASARILLPLLERELRNLTLLLGKLPERIERIILVPNPLDAYWRGYQVRAENVVYLVVGPGAERDGGALVRHELLHLFAKRIRLSSSFAMCPSRRLAKQGYVSPRALREECVVRAFDLLYRSRILKKDISRMIAREHRDFPRIREVFAVAARKIKQPRRSAAQSIR